MFITKPDILIVDYFCETASALFDDLRSNVNWDNRMHSRKTASFGEAYNYSGISYPKTEMPATLLPLCEKINKELHFSPNNCLLNYYLDGNSSMGFHSDSSEELKEGTGVAIISLGSERLITFKNIEDRSIKYNYALKSGDLLYMTKEIQKHWLHAIPKLSNAGARISLTFRNLIK